MLLPTHVFIDLSQMIAGGVHVLVQFEFLGSGVPIDITARRILHRLVKVDKAKGKKKCRDLEGGDLGAAPSNPSVPRRSHYHHP